MGNVELVLGYGVGAEVEHNVVAALGDGSLRNAAVEDVAGAIEGKAAAAGKVVTVRRVVISFIEADFG